MPARPSVVFADSVVRVVVRVAGPRVVPVVRIQAAVVTGREPVVQRGKVQCLGKPASAVIIVYDLFREREPADPDPPDRVVQPPPLVRRGHREPQPLEVGLPGPEPPQRRRQIASVEELSTLPGLRT